MHQHESHLDHARRQVAEAQARVDAQLALIDEMKRTDADTKRQEIRLTVLCNARDLKRIYLELTQARTHQDSELAAHSVKPSAPPALHPTPSTLGDTVAQAPDYPQSAQPNPA